MNTIEMLAAMSTLWSLNTLVAMLREDTTTIQNVLGGKIESTKEIDTKVARLYRQAFRPPRTTRRPWWTREQRDRLAWLEESGWTAKEIIDTGISMAVHEEEYRQEVKSWAEEGEST